MTNAMRRILALAVASLSACAPAVDAIRLSLPQALLECASVPDDLAARLWVSGQAAPCALNVNVANNTTNGACDVVPGRVRRLTIDWFVPLEREDGIDLVLAQAQKDLNLENAESETAEFVIDDGDIVTDACLDMRKDTFAGAETIVINGADVPVCDVDASGAENVVEVCAAADPFDPGVEP